MSDGVVESGPGNTQLRSDQDEHGDRHERDPVDRFIREFSSVSAFERRGVGQKAMLRHEDVFGEDGVAAGTLHARHEPGVLECQCRHGHQGQTEVRQSSAIVLHVNAARRPLRVQTTRGPHPSAGHSPATLDRRRLAVGCERAGDPGIGLRAPDVLLSAFGKETRQPRADVDQAGDPRGRSAPAAELGHHRDVGVNVGLVAAEPLRHHQPAHPRVLQCLHGGIGQTPKAIGLFRCLFEDGADARSSLDEVDHGHSLSTWTSAYSARGCLRRIRR